MAILDVDGAGAALDACEARSVRPLVATFSGPVFAACERSGGYAVLVPGAIVLVDEELREVSRLAHTKRATKVVVVGDRVFAWEPRWAPLCEGRVGELRPVHEGDATDVAILPDGFAVLADDALIVERAGVRTTRAVDVAFGGIVPWGDDIAVYSSSGVTTGRGRSEVGPTGRPVVAGDRLAFPTYSGLVYLASDLSHETLEVDLVSHVALAARGSDVFAVISDGELGRVACVRDGEVAWTSAPAAWQDVTVIGDRLVASTSRAATIFDPSSGAALGEVVGGSLLHEAVAFGDGIALRFGGRPDVAWWRPAGVEELEHDVGAGLLVRGGAGVLTSEDARVFLWRVDRDGPELPRGSTTVPLGRPIVIGASIATVEHVGRFALRARTNDGILQRLPFDVAWRDPIGRPEARAIVDAMIARRMEGELPQVPDEASLHDASAALARLPLAAQLPLQARALFSTSSLTDRQRQLAAWSRDGFFDELGVALGVSGRVLHAGVRARKVPLVPPKPVDGYEYLGTFSTEGKLRVADPSSIGKSSRIQMFLALSVDVEAREGTWHVFVRDDQSDWGKRTAELVVMHDEAFDVVAGEELAMLGVDSGRAGVFDAECPPINDDAPPMEGVVFGLGAFTRSGIGDGTYPLFGGTLHGRMAKLRIVFLDDHPRRDRTIRVRAAKPYSAKAKFAAGDTIEHVKFGTGTVVRVAAGKIDVSFADGERTLVHAK